MREESEAGRDATGASFQFRISNTMVRPQTADELLARTAEGDERALAEIFDQHAPALLGMLLRIVSEHREAQEALQQAFLSLWKEAPRLCQERVSVAAWLMLSSRAMAVDRLRARRKPAGAGSSPRQALRASPSWLPRPQEIKLIDERRELLKKVIKQLSKRQLDAVELAMFEGCDEAEIARRLGEPLAQLKAELRAAMRFFRHRLRAVLGTWAANI